MKFGFIEMLLSLWALPALFLVILYGMKKRGRVLSGFAHERGLRAIAPDKSSTRRWVKAGLVLGALLFIGIALAAPQYGYHWQEIERKGIDIIIALDCSRSMLAEDVKPTRLDRAKRKVLDLLGLLQGDRVGLAPFAGTAFLQCPLTLDYDAFQLFLGPLSPDFMPVGGTDITAAIEVSLSGFNEKDHSEKAIILITDGENTGEGDPVHAAEAARKAGVKLFCIGVGSGDGVPAPDQKGGFKKDGAGRIVLTRLDEDTLRKLALLTGGAYVRSVAGDMDLDAIYTGEIRGKMERVTLAGGRKQVWEDRYQWFLAIGIIALVIELFLPCIRKNALIPVLVCLIWPLTCFWPPPGTALARPIQDGYKAYETGDYEAALKFFIDAQIEDPDNPDILYNIGTTYYKLGNFEAAYNSFQQALNAEKPSLKQKALYNLGNATFRKGMLEDAAEHYQAALDADPKDEQARQNLEFVKRLIQQKQSEEPRQQGNGEKSEQTGEKGSQNQKDETGQQEQKEPTDYGQPRSEDGQNDKADQGDQDQASPDYGKEMKDDGQEFGQAQAPPAGQTDDGAKPGQEKPEPEKSAGQATRLLNRLKDQPGRATVPFYQKRQVEKDW